MHILLTSAALSEHTGVSTLCEHRVGPNVYAVNYAPAALYGPSLRWVFGKEAELEFTACQSCKSGRVTVVPRISFD